jgi:uncharacterized SAM-binding protein YcdF (DUF218 family)
MRQICRTVVVMSIHSASHILITRKCDNYSVPMWRSDGNFGSDLAVVLGGIGDNPDMRDFIVIFGAKLRPDGRPTETLRRRVEGAARAGARLQAPCYLVTGAAGPTGPAEAEVMRDLLLGLGIDHQAVIVEDRSRDTFDSAVNCSRLLRQRADVGRVFVASSAYHMPRCQLLLALLGLMTEKVPMASDRPWVGAARWLSYLLHEAVALPYDAALMWTTRRRWRTG